MKKKITIGLFIDTFFPMVDGVIMVVDNYARRLTKYANVIVFAPKIAGKKFDYKSLPYKVVCTKSLKVPLIDYTLPVPQVDYKFKKKLDNYKLDIVHIHSPFAIGKVGIEYAKKHNIPVVATMHSQFKQDFLRAVKSKRLATKLTSVIINVFNECDECWAVNSEVARIFYEDYGYKQLPKVMNNATDMMPVKNKEKDKNKINKLHNIKPNEKVFLFVGRINKLKNIFFIIDALKKLKYKDKDLRFKMIFVGTGQDEEELITYISEKHLENEVIMAGKITDRDLLASYYKRADLFLFPSLYDASSIVQIEAASQSTPTLFVEGAATTATVTDRVNGFISKNDTESYANYILEILRNEKLYNKVYKNAFKDLYINWDDRVKEIYEKYLELIEKGNQE